VAWHQFYVQTGDMASVESILAVTLEAHGYRRYDPFPGGAGTLPGLKTFVKHFVAPPEAGWVRVLGNPDPETLPALVAALSAGRALLIAWLSDAEGELEAYRDGQSITLDSFLQPGKSMSHIPAPPESGIDEALPGELGQFARERNVNPNQASRIIGRLTAHLFGKMDRESGGEAGALEDQARAMLSGGGQPDWNTSAGRRLRALASLLTLPASWRDPDFEAVREAYQAARMLRKNPRAQLMPGEREALKRVPNADAYAAVYAGKAIQEK
jgi:hypothetical protein